MNDMYMLSSLLLYFSYYIHVSALYSDIILPTPSDFENQTCKKWPNFALQDINPSSKRKYLEYYGLSDIDPKPDVTIVGLYYSDDTTCQENVDYQQLLKTEIESKTDWLVSSVVINNYAPINCLMNQKDDNTYCGPSSSSSSSAWWWQASWYDHEDPCYNYIGSCAPGDERLDAKTWTEPFLINSVSSSDRNSNIALKLPVFQDTEWSYVWDGFGGSQGDLFIYDAYGRLYEYYCGYDSLKYYTTTKDGSSSSSSDATSATKSATTTRCNKSIAKGGLKVDKNYLDVMSSVLAATTSRYSRCADFVNDDDIINNGDDDGGGNGNHNVDGINSKTTTMSPTQKPVTAVSIPTTGWKDKGSNNNNDDKNKNGLVSSLKKTYSRYRKHRDSLLQTSSKSSNNKTTTSHHWSGGALLASVLSFCILASVAIYLFLRWRKSRVMMAQIQFLNTRDNMAFTQLPTNDDDDIGKDEENGYDRVSGSSGSSGSKFMGYGARDNINNKINKDVNNNTNDKTKSKRKSTHHNAMSSYNDDGDNDYIADTDSAAALRSSYHYGTPVSKQQQQQVNNNNNNNNNHTDTKRGIMNSVDGKNNSSSMASTSETFYDDDNDGAYVPLPMQSAATNLRSSSSQQQQQQHFYASPPASASKLTPTTSATSISSTKNKVYNCLGTTTDLLNSDNSSNSYFDNSNNKVNNSIVINCGTDISAGYATL